VENVVVGTRPRRFAATPDGKELWVSSEVSGEVHIIDRDKFTIAGKIEFLPPAVQKTAVTPVDHVRCTSDSCRLAATPKSAGSGQNRKWAVGGWTDRRAYLIVSACVIAFASSSVSLDWNS
jgi:hypothetical protein